MLLHEMAYVYEVYRQRSFTRAAQALYISQPSLSQMIQKAERRIGAPIFDRSTSPIGLTQTGRAYIRAAEQVLQIESDFRQYLDDAERCVTGVMTLGGTTLFTSYVLPPLLSAFSERLMPRAVTTTASTACDSSCSVKSICVRFPTVTSTGRKPR